MTSDDWLTTIEDLQEVTHTGIWEWELATDSLRWSAELYRIYGEDPESFQPQIHDLEQHVHPDDRERVEADIRSTAESGGRYEHDKRVIRSDGSMRWLRCSGRLMDRDGRKVVFGTAQDVTEQRVLQKRVERYERMEAIARTTGGLAHDLTNLVNVVTLCAERMEQMDLPEEAMARLGDITDAAERATNLSRQLQMVGRKAPASAIRVDLASLLRDLEGTVRAQLGEGIELQMEVDEADDLTLETDPEHVERVLLNLCANARDAMNGHGVLHIEAGLRELGAQSVRGLEKCAPGEYVLLAVEDEGDGVDEAIRDHIFEPFVTTKGEKGTGLGLATVDGLVTGAGGFVNVGSAPSGGSRFEVYWPRKSA